MKSHYVFLYLILTHSALAMPSLDKDCDFSEFQYKRMPQERETFWMRGDDYDRHDKRQEREYNKRLVEQIVSCYQFYSENDFSACDFSNFKFDERRLQPVHPSAEYFHWRINKTDGEQIVYPAKIAYYKVLSERIKSCFTKNSLSKLRNEEFRQLYNAVKFLGDVTDDRNRLFGFLPQYSACVERHGIGKDSESIYFIHLNGLTVKDGKIDLAGQAPAKCF